MKSSLNRRKFLHRAIVPAAVGSVAMPLRLAAQTTAGSAPQEAVRPEPERPAPLDKDQVFEFVRVCHGNLDRAKELLKIEPRLIYASWDWGGGDWETGLGGASHVGRRDIADMLLDHGARKDIFAAAMRGEQNVVRAMIEADPRMAEQVGPHGFRLLYHVAISGGVPTAELVLANVEDKQFAVDQALSAAVRDGHLEMTRWLLERGATTVNTPNGLGERPLQTAHRRGDTQIGELLRRHGATDAG